jgi:SPP1 gp7 family putative phage head morphogenesis protein
VEALQGGGTYEDFANAIRLEQEHLGFEPSTHGYLRTVFNTNVVGAYSAGKDRELADPEIVEAIPLRVYVSALTDRTRPHHAALHGTSWDARENSGWREYQPPNDFNCMCAMVSVDSEDGAETVAQFLAERDSWVGRIVPVQARGSLPRDQAVHPNPLFALVPNLDI